MEPKANANKSNRARADIYELALIRSISDLYGLPFPYETELEARKEAVREAFPEDGEEKIAEQLRRADEGAYELIDIFEGERGRDRVGELTEMEWVGTQQSEGLADIAGRHSSDAKTLLSAKTVGTAGSKGTQKNIGGVAIAKYLGVDPEPLIEKMCAEACQALGLEKTVTKKVLKAEAKRWRDSGKDVTTPIGKRAVKKLVRQIWAAEDRWDLDGLLAFIEGRDHELGKNDALYVVVAGPDGTTVSPARVSRGVVTMRRGSEISTILQVNGVDVYRIQWNCTNGLGMSPLCGRTFQTS